MTEEDAKRVIKAASQKTEKASKQAIHISVRLTGAASKKLGHGFYAATIGKGLEAINNRSRVYKGKDALKKFVKFDRNRGAAIGRVDVNETDFKEFEKKCKAKGVDFAIVKDQDDPNVVHFFFSGKYAEVMSYAFEEYAREKFKQERTGAKSEGEREKESHVKDKDKVKEKAKEKAEEIKEETKEKAKAKTEEVKNKATEVAEKGKEVADKVTERLEREVEFEK